jgi:ribosomal-protein-alanine N-acetyltransferase
VPGDTAAVTALELALFTADAWSEGSVAAELTGPGRQAVVAVEDGTLVGYVVTLQGPDVVDLQRIGVDPGHRRRGTATALLDAVLSRADHTGADRMLLEVSAGNAAALAFYAAAGFVEIDRRRRYYRDGSDAVVMRRSLRRAACGGRG